MRLSARSRVLLPQPLGPMIAVIRPLAAEKSTLRSAWKSPYQASRPCVSTAGEGSTSVATAVTISEATWTRNSADI